VRRWHRFFACCRGRIDRDSFDRLGVAYLQGTFCGLECTKTDMEFCDLNCEYARWPEDEGLDGSGSCRTFQAIYCTKMERHVHKNMPCAEKKKRESQSPVTEEGTSS